MWVLRAPRKRSAGAHRWCNPRAQGSASAQRANTSSSGTSPASILRGRTGGASQSADHRVGLPLLRGSVTSGRRQPGGCPTDCMMSRTWGSPRVKCTRCWPRNLHTLHRNCLAGIEQTFRYCLRAGCIARPRHSPRCHRTSVANRPRMELQTQGYTAPRRSGK